MRTVVICVALAVATSSSSRLCRRRPSPAPAQPDRPPPRPGLAVAGQRGHRAAGPAQRPGPTRARRSRRSHGRSDDAEVRSLAVAAEGRRPAAPCCSRALPSTASVDAPLPLPEAPVPTIPAPRHVGQRRRGRRRLGKGRRPSWRSSPARTPVCGRRRIPTTARRPTPTSSTSTGASACASRCPRTARRSPTGSRARACPRRIRWGDRWRMRGFGRIEFGFNMVNNNPVFITGGDPGFSVGQGGQVLGTRLGLRRTRHAARHGLLRQAVVGLLRRVGLHRPVRDLRRRCQRHVQRRHRRRDLGHGPRRDGHAVPQQVGPRGARGAGAVPRAHGGGEALRRHVGRLGSGGGAHTAVSPMNQMSATSRPSPVLLFYFSGRRADVHPGYVGLDTRCTVSFGSSVASTRRVGLHRPVRDVRRRCQRHVQRRHRRRHLRHWPRRDAMQYRNKFGPRGARAPGAVPRAHVRGQAFRRQRRRLAGHRTSCRTSTPASRTTRCVTASTSRSPTSRSAATKPPSRPAVPAAAADAGADLPPVRATTRPTTAGTTSTRRARNSTASTTSRPGGSAGAATTTCGLGRTARSATSG